MIELKPLIQLFPQAVNDSRLMKSILMDMYPNERGRNIRILINFMECGIVDELQSKQIQKLNILEKNKYIQKFGNEFAVSSEISTPLLMVWLKALDIKCDDIDIPVMSEPKMIDEPDIPVIPEPEKIDEPDIPVIPEQDNGKGIKRRFRLKWIFIFFAIFITLFGIYLYREGKPTKIAEYINKNNNSQIQAQINEDIPHEETIKYGFIVQKAIIPLGQEYILEYSLPEGKKCSLNFDKSMISITSYNSNSLQISGLKIGETILSIEDENHIIISECEISIIQDSTISDPIQTVIPLWSFENNDITIHVGETVEFHFSVPDFSEYNYYAVGVDSLDISLKNNNTFILKGLASGTAWIYLNRGNETVDTCIVRVISP